MSGNALRAIIRPARWTRPPSQPLIARIELAHTYRTATITCTHFHNCICHKQSTSQSNINTSHTRDRDSAVFRCQMCCWAIREPQNLQHTDRRATSPHTIKVTRRRHVNCFIDKFNWRSNTQLALMIRKVVYAMYQVQFFDKTEQTKTCQLNNTKHN